MQQRGRITAFAPGVVSGVPEERRAEVEEVNPKLVHAARLGDQLDEGRRATVLEHPITSRGRAARRMNGGPSGRRQRLDREDAAARTVHGHADQLAVRGDECAAFRRCEVRP